MREYELYHHGIKGQKWGIRRTAAQLGHRVAGAAKKTGKVLYKGASKAGKATGKAVGKGAKMAKKAAVAKVKQSYKEHKEKAYYEKLHKKKLSQMTDKEIADLTKRVKQEANLKDAKYESRVQNARKFYKNVAQQPVNTFLATYSKAVVEKAFKGTKDDNNDGDNNNNNNNNSSNGKKNGGNKKGGNKSSNVNFDFVMNNSPRDSKKDNKKAFDDYFESEVQKEQERRRQSAQIIRR